MGWVAVDPELPLDQSQYNQGAANGHRHIHQGTRWVKILGKNVFGVVRRKEGSRGGQRGGGAPWADPNRASLDAWNSISPGFPKPDWGLQKEEERPG